MAADVTDEIIQTHYLDEKETQKSYCTLNVLSNIESSTQHNAVLMFLETF